MNIILWPFFNSLPSRRKTSPNSLLPKDFGATSAESLLAYVKIPGWIYRSTNHLASQQIAKSWVFRQQLFDERLVHFQSIMQKAAFASVCSWATLRVKEMTSRELQKEYNALSHKEEELWTKSRLSRRTSTNLCRAASLLAWVKSL